MLGSALSAISNGLKVVALWIKERARAAAEATGAIKQREADQRDLLEEKDEQLREATEHRPGDWRRAARNGDF